MNWHVDESGLPQSLALNANHGFTFRALFEGWQHPGELLDAWAQAHRGAPFEAYCWEMPPLTADDLDRPFRCVFVHSPALAAAHPEPGPFREHFETASRLGHSIATFESLGRDALLVAPCPRGESSSHTHIAAFHRRASADQVQQLWLAVGAAAGRRIGQTPFWLSTAGLGVHWLHVRFDTRPKYYRHRSYADPRYWSAPASPS